MPMVGRAEQGFFVNESRRVNFAIQLQNISCNFAPENNKHQKIMSHHHEHHEHDHCCSHNHRDHDHCCSHEHGEHEHVHEHEHEHGEHEHHHHHHDHDGLKRQLLLIAATALLLVGAVLIEKHCQLATWQLLLVYLVPYLLIGHETLHEAVEGVAHGDAFNEHFLMSVATIGALAIGFLPGAETQFPEAVFVMLFFQVGELFEGYAEGKSRDSIAHLMDIRPDVARVVTPSGSLDEVSPEQVAVGSTIEVRPGEKIPLDGIVEEGTSSLSTVALTGESQPRDVAQGDEVVSGCVNLSGVLRVRTTKIYGESTVAKIISLVENAGEHKSKSEAFITRFARIYTPVVVMAALALALLPPLFSSVSLSPIAFQWQAFTSSFPTWLYRALLFLVVSCPCALVISVPLTFFGGIGGASRHGILIKGANYMDVLSKVSTVVFDKTGTLTRGQFAVEAVHPNNCDEGELLHLAAHVEHFSTHPIAVALCEAYAAIDRQSFPLYSSDLDCCEVSDVEERAGQGIQAKVAGRLVSVGNTRLMEALGVTWSQCHHSGTVLHVAIDGIYAGHIAFNDQLKPESHDAVERLKSLGVGHVVMLTGDRKEVAAHVAEELGLTDYHAELLPADKVQMMVEASQGDGEKQGATVFVGDGINDAPVLARADVGIAMGGLGSDAAIEAADVVIMDDNPSKVADAISIARRTIAIARQNVWFAIGVKILVLLLATFGLATMWMAVFADVGVTVLAVLNAMRALRHPHF